MALNVKRVKRNLTLKIVAVLAGFMIPFLLVLILGLTGFSMTNNPYANIGIALAIAILFAIIVWLILIGSAKMYDTKKQRNANRLVMEERMGLAKNTTKEEVKAERQRLKELKAEEARKNYALRKNMEFTKAKKKHSAYID